MIATQNCCGAIYTSSASKNGDPMVELRAERPQRWFEGVEGWNICRVDLKLIPIPDGSWEKGRYADLISTERHPEAWIVSTSVCWWLLKILSPVDVYMVESDSIHHSQTALETSTLKRGPLQFLKHGSHTTGAVSCSWQIVHYCVELVQPS